MQEVAVRRPQESEVRTVPEKGDRLSLHFERTPNGCWVAVKYITSQKSVKVVVTNPPPVSTRRKHLKDGERAFATVIIGDDLNKVAQPMCHQVLASVEEVHQIC